MSKFIEEMKNGWGRVIVTILLSGLAAWGGANFALGQYKEKVDTNRVMLEYLREHGTDESLRLRDRITRLESQFDYIKEALDEIKANQKQGR